MSAILPLVEALHDKAAIRVQTLIEGVELAGTFAPAWILEELDISGGELVWSRV